VHLGSLWYAVVPLFLCRVVHDDQLPVCEGKPLLPVLVHLVSKVKVPRRAKGHAGDVGSRLQVALVVGVPADVTLPVGVEVHHTPVERLSCQCLDLGLDLGDERRKGNPFERAPAEGVGEALAQKDLAARAGILFAKHDDLLRGVRGVGKHNLGE